MNTPTLTSKRLILRKFNENDIEAIYKIYSDVEVNQFLPWFPLKNVKEAQQFFQKVYVAEYQKSRAYAYAICLKENNIPIGYIKVSMEEPYDLGYGLKKEFWHKGIVTEVAKTLLFQLKKDKVTYITATHDRNNPRSGGVMKNIGMKYCYSYEELWQPKNKVVIFRMYQLNLDGNEKRIYLKYWKSSSNHFVEKDI